MQIASLSNSAQTVSATKVEGGIQLAFLANLATIGEACGCLPISTPPLRNGWGYTSEGQNSRVEQQCTRTGEEGKMQENHQRNINRKDKWNKSTNDLKSSLRASGGKPFGIKIPLGHTNWKLQNEKDK